MKKIKAYLIVGKMALFMFAGFIFIPFAFVMGPVEYAAGLERTLLKYLSQINDLGVLNKEEYEDLKSDMEN